MASWAPHDAPHFPPRWPPVSSVYSSHVLTTGPLYLLFLLPTALFLDIPTFITFFHLPKQSFPDHCYPWLAIPLLCFIFCIELLTTCHYIWSLFTSQTYAVQYGSDWPHVATEHMKCGCFVLTTQAELCCKYNKHARLKDSTKKGM